MNGTSRIVRRLRLRARSEAAVHRGVALVEDALRTASLPDTAGRLVIVRRLALGRIDSRVAPQMVAQQLERAFARLTPRCVHGGDAGASEAQAVWFRDALEAHTRLAITLLDGLRAHDWYWKLAVRTWEPEAPLPHALRSVMFSLAALSEAPTALPRWTAALVGAGHAARLIAALEVEDVPRLAQAAAVRTGAGAIARLRASEAPHTHDDANASRAHIRTRAGVERRSRASLQRSAVDPRHDLVKALLAAAGARAEGTLLTGESRSFPDALPSFRGESGKSRQQPAIDGAQTDDGQSPEATQTRAASVPSADREVSRASDAGHRTDPVVGGERGTASAPLPTWIAPDSVTRAGGLLFLLPVLQRLGYPDWLEDEPGWIEWDIAKRVLAGVLARLQIAPEDPAWALVTSFSRARTTPRRFVAPVRWRDGLAHLGDRMFVADLDSTQTLWDASGRLLLGSWTGRCPRALAAAWRRAGPHSGSRAEHDRVSLVTSAWSTAARRWLRRYARVGLADLVLRPAIQALTPTHVDLHFEMPACELRVRRAGLDFDPGWVPWFGRVVTFRYR